MQSPNYPASAPLPIPNKKAKAVRKQRPTFQLGTGFPVRMNVRLVYEDLITLSPGTPLASYVFRGNSLYDPDYTGTGHQPRYYDQLTPIYGRYKVLASECFVEMINGGANSGAIFALTPNTEILTFTTWQLASELPRSKVSEIIPVASRYPFKLRSKASTTQICGLLPYQVNDEDWSASVGSNPLQLWYWNINISSIDTSTNLAVSMRVRLVYDAVMYDRLDVGTS